jgi:hypothetical protein
MSLSSLPPYPNPSEDRWADAQCKTDWGLFLCRLVILTVAWVLGGMIAFAMALAVTAGQILRLFLGQE